MLPRSAVILRDGSRGPWRMSSAGLLPSCPAGQTRCRSVIFFAVLRFLSVTVSCAAEAQCGALAACSETARYHSTALTGVGLLGMINDPWPSRESDRNEEAERERGWGNRAARRSFPAAGFFLEETEA